MKTAQKKTVGMAASGALVSHAKAAGRGGSLMRIRPQMTRALAEKVAVGSGKAPQFDGVAFLKSLKK